MKIYPNYNWIEKKFHLNSFKKEQSKEEKEKISINNEFPWKFSTIITSNFWNNIKNKRKYFDWLSKELNIKSFEEWYSVDPKIVSNKFYGKKLMKYRQTVLKFYQELQSAYPEYDFLPWKFYKSPRNIINVWKDFINHKKYFDFLSKTLNIQNNEDWYDVKMNDIYKTGGSTLLSTCYEDSLFKALTIIFPNIKFDQWKFKYLDMNTEPPPKEVVTQEEYKKIVEILSDKLKIKTLDDWYRIGKQQLATANVNLIVKRYGGI